MIRLPRLTAIAAAAVLFALPVFAACGGDDDDAVGGSTPTTPPSETVELDTWTAGLCSSVTTWLDDVTTLSDFEIADGAEPDEIKDTMVDFLTNVDERTRTFREDVGGLGDPDTGDGAAIQSAFEAAADDVVAIFSGALEDARALDASDPARLAEQLVALGDAITAASDEVGETFAQIDADYDTTEISEAALDIPECSGIFSE